jgi:glucose-6-phosphate 1-dehydrogenase
MLSAEDLDELMVCRLDTERRTVEPCSIVIFGASGDLTSRKLIPALYHLHQEGLLPDDYRIVGFSRSEKTDESWRGELHEALRKFSRSSQVEETSWREFSSKIHYCRGDIDNADSFTKLNELVSGFGEGPLSTNRLFYLAISPSHFSHAVEQLCHAGLVCRDDPNGWQRVVVEKPFGHDLASARDLNHEMTQHIREHQIFRIDHYLGKETVQNILTFRFSNGIFERLWSRDCVDHVQITVSESLGVGRRGGYYEEAGALRDMVQNHILQVMSLIAMEPPVSLDSEPIRNEKVKLLESIRPISPAQVDRSIVRGQYTAGELEGSSRGAYRQEPLVAPASNVETYAALKLHVDNWRWAGVPFYVRTGKCLPMSASEVRVQFRPTPHVLFAARCGPNLDANAITIRLQPNEGITLRINGKVPGASMQIRPVRMHFSYDAEFGAYTPGAYERLLLDALAGDSTLFLRRDEVEAAWAFVDQIREGWKGRALSENEFYPAGSWGPKRSDELLARAGHAWREPQPLQRTDQGERHD